MCNAHANPTGFWYNVEWRLWFKVRNHKIAKLGDFIFISIWFWYVDILLFFLLLFVSSVRIFWRYFGFFILLRIYRMFFSGHSVHNCVCVMCHVSCHVMSCHKKNLFLRSEVVELFGQGSVITGAYPVRILFYLKNLWIYLMWFSSYFIDFQIELDF